MRSQIFTTYRLISILIVFVSAIEEAKSAPQSGNETTARNDRPNIVFIFSDDHATHAIGAYDGWLKSVNPTPNIDRLAREGMLFQEQLLHEFNLWSQPGGHSDWQTQPRERIHEQR